MSQAFIENGFKQAKNLLFIQIILVLMLASLGLFKEHKVAMALLSGGITVVFSNLYFVFKVFSQSGAQASKQVLRAFYLGEAIKIILLAGLIAIAFRFLPGFEGYVLVGYIVALLSQWLAPIIIKMQSTGLNSL